MIITISYVNSLFVLHDHGGFLLGLLFSQITHPYFFLLSFQFFFLSLKSVLLFLFVNTARIKPNDADIISTLFLLRGKSQTSNYIYSKNEKAHVCLGMIALSDMDE